MMLAAPPLASIVTAGWSKILTYGDKRFQRFLVQSEKRRVLRELRKFIREQESRIKRTEQERLTPAQIKQIQANIDRANRAYIDKDFSRIEEHLK